MPYYNPYQYYTPYTQQYNRPAVLQGKTVDNIDVVRAIDIPLDGTTSYFPLADGTAIASKQLQQDGTSRIIIYKPILGDQEKQTKYVTETDLENIKKEIEELKKKVGEQHESNATN